MQRGNNQEKTLLELSVQEAERPMCYRVVPDTVVDDQTIKGVMKINYLDTVSNPQNFSMLVIYK
eukprot:snap_masked-scaffold_4-processed-gene-19.35-mRNA-1 protein AED:1.00 eAED:1.00 QI:0/-1/0/0/-1/1/1/0/63